MIHILRRFLPLVLGAWGGLFGSLTGWLLHQLASRSVDYLWPPWLGWNWLVGFLAYPAVGFLLAIPFVAVYPGRPQPLQTERGRVVEAQLRTWVAVFATLYLPVGFGFLYHHWWGAPLLPLPFTDVSLHSGSRGDLVATMIAVSVLAPFCGAGIERLMRGTPAFARVLFGPPLATMLALGGVLAAVLVSGSLAAMNMGAVSTTDVQLFGPLLQPMGSAGWDTRSVLALITVVAGCLGGALCTLTTTMPVLSGLVDVHPRESRRRWLLPLTAVAVSGVLALVALLQGFGIDSFLPLRPVIRPGQPGIVGNLVAPSDHDTLRFEPGDGGLYLLEFPSPGPHQRHLVNINAHKLPSGRDDTLRYLVDVDAYGPYFEVSIQPVWPLRNGVSSYSGPLRFEPVESVPLDGGGRARSVSLDLEPGQLRTWSLELKGGATELVLDADTAAYWTILGPSLQYTGSLVYPTGRSAVLVDVTFRGQILCEATLDADSYSDMGRTLSLGAVGPVDPGGAVRLILTPSVHPGAKIKLTVVGEGVASSDDMVHPSAGTSLLPARPGLPVAIRPEPGGTVTSASVVSLGAGAVELIRLQDDGTPVPGAGDLLLMGETRFRVDDPAERPAPALIVVGAGGPDQSGMATWGWGGGFYR